MNNKRSCLTCKKDTVFRKCTILHDNEEYKKVLQNVIDKGKVDSDDVEYSDEAYEFKDKFICENFKSRYIEYPLEVSKIDIDNDMSGFRDDYRGSFVKIRPCGEKYNKKTYLGIYLGDLPKGHRISHNPDTKVLSVSFDTNPAIFVFELNEIIFGCQSWWGFIKNEEELKKHNRY